MFCNGVNGKSQMYGVPRYTGIAFVVMLSGVLLHSRATCFGQARGEAPPNPDSNGASSRVTGESDGGPQATTQSAKIETQPGMILRQVWAGPDVLNAVGSPSPDGRYMTWVNWPNLAIHDFATGESRDLTKEGWSSGNAMNSVFSPDGKQIAYTWLAEESELWVIGTDGSEPRKLGRGRVADWSTDGKYILSAIDQGRTSQIALVAVADRSVRVLKSLDHPAVGPLGHLGQTTSSARLSPDGRYVAYASAQKDSANRNVSLLAIDGSHEAPVVEHSADDFVVGWSPDGKQLIFSSDRSGPRAIWVLQIVNGKPKGEPEFVKELGMFASIGLTRNGTYYYAIGTQDNFTIRRGDVYVATLEPQSRKVAAPPVRAIQRFEGSNHAPVWSPDGRYLACQSRRPGMGTVLCIKSVETGEVHDIVPRQFRFRWNEFSLRWSPDGRSFLTVGWDQKNRRGIYQIDAQTGVVSPIVQKDVTGKWGFFHPEWSPDGNAIFYLLQAGEILVRHETKTGVEKVIYPDAVGFSISPDGRHVVYLNRTGSLMLMAVDGGVPRQLAQVQQKSTAPWHPNEAYPLAWTPNGEHVLFGKRRVGGNDDVELYCIAALGGKVQTLGLSMRGHRHLRIHPDGRRIAFDTFSRSTAAKVEIWAMENFLPPASHETKSE